MEDTYPRTSSPSTISLWFYVLAGPLVWTVHFLAVYGLVELACKQGVLGSIVLGMTVLAWVLILLTVIALAITVYAGIRSYRSWRDLLEKRGEEISESGGGEADPWLAQGRRQFMALSGVVLTLPFALMILLSAVPVLLLRICPWT